MLRSIKKCFRLEFGPKGAKIGPKTRFFVIFSSLVHQFSLKLHTDSLQQCKISSRGKTYEKIFWALIWAKTGQNQNQNCFFFLPFSQVWFVSFPLIAQNNSLEQCLTTSRGKTRQKKFRGPNFDQTGQN